MSQQSAQSDKSLTRDEFFEISVCLAGRIFELSHRIKSNEEIMSFEFTPEKTRQHFKELNEDAARQIQTLEVIRKKLFEMEYQMRLERANGQ